MENIEGTYQTIDEKEYEIYYDVIREGRRSKRVLIAKQVKSIFNLPLSSPFPVSEEQIVKGVKFGTWRKIK